MATRKRNSTLYVNDFPKDLLKALDDYGKAQVPKQSRSQIVILWIKERAEQEQAKQDKV